MNRIARGTMAKGNHASQSSVDRLADVLERENAALQRLDMPAAVALVPEKEAAIRLLSDAAVDLTAPEQGGVAERLMRLTQENHALLERAITVQARVIEIVAQAYRPPPELRTYGPNGARAMSRTAWVAFSSQA